jgi:hypothetical protein
MPKATNSKAIMGEVKNLAMVAGGFVIGSMGGSAIDRALKVDSGIPGINAKRFVKPSSPIERRNLWRYETQEH